MLPLKTRLAERLTFAKVTNAANGTNMNCGRVVCQNLCWPRGRAVATLSGDRGVVTDIILYRLRTPGCFCSFVHTIDRLCFLCGIWLSINLFLTNLNPSYLKLLSQSERLLVNLYLTLVPDSVRF